MTNIDLWTDAVLPSIASREWPGGLAQFRAACQVALRDALERPATDLTLDSDTRQQFHALIAVAFNSPPRNRFSDSAAAWGSRKTSA